ncbi:MAG: SRPBCC family protein [Nannocystales bacterium]
MNNQTFSIKHRIELDVKPASVYDAVSTQAGLASWWTTMVETSGELGSLAAFRFGDGEHGADMRIDTLTEGMLVRWHCVDGPWKGLDFTFDIQPHERGSVLRFENSGWPETGDFYMHCNAKWGFFLAVSLKQLLETGAGVPHPDDPRI